MRPVAADTLGLDADGVPTPLWTAHVGFAEVADGVRLFAARPDGCVAAVDATSGKQVWSWSDGKAAPVMGLAASPRVLLVATGETRGHAPAMVYSTTDRLVGLDPRTGVQRWAMPLADDGQTVPAVAAGDRVVVAEADGTLVGLDAATGAQRWLDRPPHGCRPSSMPAGLLPIAVLLPGAPAATVAYQCANRQRLVRLDPASGASRWTWSLPAGWSVQSQSPAGAAAGAIGVLASGRGAAVAPVAARASMRPNGGYETDAVIAVDSTSGKPLWQVDGVPVSAGVYGGGGQLCVASGFGVACHAAHSGSVSWQWQPLVTPSDGGPAGPIFLGTVTDGGRLYLTAPTAAARSIPPGSTSYRSPPGAFQLHEIDMATGRTLGTTPLPAFHHGPDSVVVSAQRSPPGVVAVGHDEVFVSPQLHDTDIVEAFALPSTASGVTAGLG